MRRPTIRGRSSASTRAISQFSKISRTRAAPAWLSADTSTVVASISRQDSCGLCSIACGAHASSARQRINSPLSSLWTRGACQGQGSEKARFEETCAIPITVKNARRCEGRHLHPRKPGKARLMDADHLLGGKRLPGAAKAGAHLTALTQPHGVRNRCFAYRSTHKSSDDRRNRGRRQFGHGGVLEAGERRVGPPAERGLGQQVSQQQTSRTDQRQNLQTRLHAHEVQFRSRKRVRFRRTIQRDSSLHRLLTGHVRQRRPSSSRPTSQQASLRVRAVDLRKGGRLRIPRSFIGDASLCGGPKRGGKAAMVGALHITQRESYSRRADCGLSYLQCWLVSVIAR